MASLTQVFDVSKYKTKAAQKIALEQQAEDLLKFIKGLKARKSIVISELLAFKEVGYDTLITLASFHLQLSLYCRREKSTLAARQLSVEELIEAMQAYYAQDYVQVAEYASFLKELILLLC